MASRARKRARPDEITTRRINNCKAWTSDQDERLREFVISNASLFDIADELGRTVVAVKARACNRNRAAALAFYGEGKGKMTGSYQQAGR
jgi:hypothetical protein